MMTCNVVFGEWVYMLKDIGLGMVMIFYMTRSKALPFLAKVRPTATLLGFRTVCTIGTQAVLKCLRVGTKNGTWKWPVQWGFSRKNYGKRVFKDVVLCKISGALGSEPWNATIVLLPVMIAMITTRLRLNNPTPLSVTSQKPRIDRGIYTYLGYFGIMGRGV